MPLPERMARLEEKQLVKSISQCFHQRVILFLEGVQEGLGAMAGVDIVVCGGRTRDMQDWIAIDG
jgi:hypothetical protein